MKFRDSDTEADTVTSLFSNAWPRTIYVLDVLMSVSSSQVIGPQNASECSLKLIAFDGWFPFDSRFLLFREGMPISGSDVPDELS